MGTVSILLAAAGIGWSIAGLVSAAIGLVGAEWLAARLPPLAIDSAAVGGAATAVGGGLLLLGASHLAIAAGLRRAWRWPPVAGVLLCGTLAALLVASAAAAVASAVRSPEGAAALLAGSAALLTAAAGYAWGAGRLVRRIGHMGGIGPGGAG